MSDYLEGSLSRLDRRRLDKHLANCPHCSLYLEQLLTTITASGSVGPDDLSPEVVDGLVNLFRQFRKDE
jgi:anti-sigma factor RsiW